MHSLVGRCARHVAMLCALMILATSMRAQSGARAPRATFSYDKNAPLALQVTPSSSPRTTVSVFQVSYASPGGDRVTGFMAVPNTAGPHAGVILMHGLPGRAEPTVGAMGLEIAERGAVVLGIDAPWVRRNGLPDFTPRDSAEQVQLMKDLQRAVDVLVARPDVDARRIAYMGVSYGGAMGALFVGIERRLAAGVLVVPDGGLVAHFTDARGNATGPLAGVSAAVRERWLAAMRPVEPINYIADASPTPLLFQNGRTDALVTNEDAEALHAAARDPKKVEWYDGGHSLTPAARTARLDWLFERIGRPPR